MSDTVRGVRFLDSNGDETNHTSLPWAYVTPDAPNFGLPVGFATFQDEQAETFALGWTNSIACASATVDVWVEGGVEVERWLNDSAEDVIRTAGTRPPIAVVSHAVNGTILLTPRSILEDQDRSLFGADQPILEPDLRASTEGVRSQMISRFLNASADGLPLDSPGCFFNEPALNTDLASPESATLSELEVPVSAPAAAPLPPLPG